MGDDTAGLDLTALRARAVEVAYRMLGSRTEAEDIAQETIVRVQAALGREEIRTPAAYTTTVATRLAIDHLRSARVRRESYVGPWLPEPISGLSASAPGHDDVVARAELADSVSFAMLVVLESLGPVERAAFLLHDTFGYGYDELAVILDRSEAACRQLVSRARTRVAEGRPRFRPDPEEHRELLARFVDAAQRGDVDGLLAVLAPDAVFVSDGGANVMAARHPIMGADRVSRFVSHVWTKPREGVEVELTTVNGEPGIAVWVDGVLTDVGTAEILDGRISTMHFVRNPDKLHWVEHEPG
jgi:RNA polymerase sigma-70 factor, ECF subfamily